MRQYDDRGGSWYNSARFCRSASRSGSASGVWSDILGFRPAFRLKKVKR